MSAINQMTEPNDVEPEATPVEADGGGEYVGPMIDLKSLRYALRRWRAFWLAAAVLGMVIGAGFHFAVPPKYTAVTDLYMTEPTNIDPADAIANDLSLLETRNVAQQALSSLHLDENPSVFLATYQGTAASNVVLTIKLTAPTSTDAVTYDNAVANAFLAVRAQELEFQTKLVVDGLRTEVNSLNSDMRALTQEIGSLLLVKADPQSANQVTGLVNQRTGDASQVNQLQSQEAQDLLAEQSVVQGTKVLDPAASVRVSAKRVTATDALTGLVGGLGLGIAIIIVGALLSDRPRRRAQVAAALGVPVELSLGSYRRPRVMQKWRLRRSLSRPVVPLQLINGRLLGHLEAEPSCALAVVALGPTDVAALAVGSLAYALAAEGKRVVVVDMIEGRPLARLFGVKAEPGMLVAAGADGVELTLVLAGEEPSDVAMRFRGEADAVLVLANVAPAIGADHIAVWADSAVVVVTAGKVSATGMSSCTQILAHSGIRVNSAILIGSDPHDDSAGLVIDETELARPSGEAQAVVKNVSAHGPDTSDDNGNGNGNGNGEARVYPARVNRDTVPLPRDHQHGSQLGT
jgi:capsular polysaccharide biosynthesis protein